MIIIMAILSWIASQVTHAAETSPFTIVPYYGGYRSMSLDAKDDSLRIFGQNERVILHITTDGVVFLRGKAIGRDAELGQSVRDTVTGVLGLSGRKVKSAD